MVASKRLDGRELDPGTSFGPYRVEATLGEGAVGVVYLVTDTRTRERFAVKVLKADLARDPICARRFKREAAIARDIVHPNLLPVVELGIVDACPYHVTPYVPGRSLKRRLEAHGALPLDDVVQMAAEIGSALDLLHSRQLVHRDVKPGNILLGSKGMLLGDFGLVTGAGHSVLTKEGLAVGTVGYMAPELILGRAATAASDVYSLACVVFEALVGSRPFPGRSELEVAFGHLDRTAPDPISVRSDLPASASEPLRWGLAKNPEERPPSAAVFVDNLRSNLTG